MSLIFRILMFIGFVINKGSRDIISTLYDDFDFRFMSLPRIGLAIGIIAVLVSWIAQQFYGFKFEYFPQLIQLVIALAATYGVKKYVEKDVSKNG